MAGKCDHLLPVYTDEELASEKWKLVYLDGVPYRRYAVSNLGRVRNLVTGKVLKLLWCHASLTPHSVYWRVCIRARKKTKAVFVHRLVAEAFVPGRTKRKKVVHHKDANPSNPRASNLEWCTHSKNIKYAQAWRDRWAEKRYGYNPEPDSTDVSDLLADLPPVQPYDASEDDLPF